MPLFISVLHKALKNMIVTLICALKNFFSCDCHMQENENLNNKPSASHEDNKKNVCLISEKLIFIINLFYLLRYNKENYFQYYNLFYFNYTICFDPSRRQVNLYSWNKKWNSSPFVTRKVNRTTPLKKSPIIYKIFGIN